MNLPLQPKSEKKFPNKEVLDLDYFIHKEVNCDCILGIDINSPIGNTKDKNKGGVGTN